jgi:hypothetical protein
VPSAVTANGRVGGDEMHGKVQKLTTKL